MDPGAHGWLGEALFSGVVLGLAVWQWVSVRRVIAARRKREALRPPPERL
jgi:hypothetical protein